MGQPSTPPACKRDSSGNVTGRGQDVRVLCLASAQPAPLLPSPQPHLPAVLPRVKSIRLSCPSADTVQRQGQLWSSGLFPVHWLYSKLLALWTKTSVAAEFPGKEWYVRVTLGAFGLRFYVEPADLRLSGVMWCCSKADPATLKLCGLGQVISLSLSGPTGKVKIMKPTWRVG